VLTPCWVPADCAFISPLFTAQIRSETWRKFTQHQTGHVSGLLVSLPIGDADSSPPNTLRGLMHHVVCLFTSQLTAPIPSGMARLSCPEWLIHTETGHCWSLQGSDIDQDDCVTTIPTSTGLMVVPVHSWLYFPVSHYCTVATLAYILDFTAASCSSCWESVDTDHRLFAFTGVWCCSDHYTRPT